MLRRHARAFSTESKKKRKSSQEKEMNTEMWTKREAEKGNVFDLLCNIVVKDCRTEHDLVQTMYSISTYATQNINKPLLKS